MGLDRDLALASFQSMPWPADGVDGGSVHIVDGAEPQLFDLATSLQQAGLHVVLLTPEQGLESVVSSLQKLRPKDGFQAIHLYGHGTPGRQELGSDAITGASLKTDANSWRQLAELCSADADLLLYGCGVGSGTKGRELLADLAALTTLDVAASDDITGLSTHVSKADWQLEVRHGSLEANAIDAGRLGWQGSLKPTSPSWLNVLSEDKEETLLDSIAGQRGKSLRKASFMGYHLTNQGSSSNVTVALQDFWDRVADRTNGKLNMSVLPSDANLEGADNEALLGAANGRFDAVTANGPIYSGIIPQVANIMTLLFAYNNSQEGRKLVNRPVFQKALLKAGKPFDLRFLTKATLNSGMRDICTIPGHPINSAADLTGFKLRIPPSTAIEDQLKALDVVPLLTPISELDDVLISGEAYGEENPPSFIQTFNLKGITDQLSLTNHLWTGFLTAINLETWKSWPKDWRKIVLSEQKALQNQQWVPQDELNEQIIAEAPTTYDMTVVTPDMSAVLTDDDFIKTRNSVIRGLAPSLRPLARALVKGYRANR